MNTKHTHMNTCTQACMHARTHAARTPKKHACTYARNMYMYACTTTQTHVQHTRSMDVGHKLAYNIIPTSTCTCMSSYTTKSIRIPIRHDSLKEKQCCASLKVSRNKENTCTHTHKYEHTHMHACMQHIRTHTDTQLAETG